MTKIKVSERREVTDERDVVLPIYRVDTLYNERSESQFYYKFYDSKRGPMMASIVIREDYDEFADKTFDVSVSVGRLGSIDEATLNAPDAKAAWDSAVAKVRDGFAMLNSTAPASGASPVAPDPAEHR